MLCHSYELGFEFLLPPVNGYLVDLLKIIDRRIEHVFDYSGRTARNLQLGSNTRPTFVTDNKPV